MKVGFPGTFEEVGPPWWDDAPAIVVGTGPSLKGFDFEQLRGLGHTLAINAAILDLPWADAFFTLDIPFVKREHGYLITLARRLPVYIGQPDDWEKAAYPPLVDKAHYVKRRRENNKLSENLDVIESGGNSGFGGFNLAVHKRPKHIALFGFDYSQGDHYCPERYAHQPDGHNGRYYPNWARCYDCTVEQINKLGIKVINASPQSSLKAFERTTIDNAIAYLKMLKVKRDASAATTAATTAAATT